MTTTFFERAGFLTARINLGMRGECLRISTRISIEGKVFDTKTQKFRGKDSESMRANSLLLAIQALVSNSNVTPLTSEQLRVKIRQKIDGEQVTMHKQASFKRMDILVTETWDFLNKHRRFEGKMETISNKTIETYASAVKIYTEFAQENNQYLSLREIDVSNTSIENRKKATKTIGNHFAAFKSFLLQKGYRLGTQAHYVNSIIFLFKRIEENEFTTFPKVQRAGGDESPIITVPEDFLLPFLMDDAGLYEKMSPEEKAGYEIACLMIWTALRVEDAFTVNPQSFIERDGTLFYTGIHQKTKARVQVPLPEYVADRIKKNINTFGGVYSSDLTDGNVNASHKVGKAIKKALKCYPEMLELHSEERLSPDGKKTITITKPWHEWLTPHTMRKTAITLLLMKGVPERDVRMISGHSSKSTAFERYVNHSETAIHSNVRNLHKQLFG